MITIAEPPKANLGSLVELLELVITWEDINKNDQNIKLDIEDITTKAVNTIEYIKESIMTEDVAPLCNIEIQKMIGLIEVLDKENN